jgi:hypothetical protein
MLTQLDVFVLLQDGILESKWQQLNKQNGR